MNLTVQSLHIDAPQDGRARLDVAVSTGKQLTLWAASYDSPSGWLGKAGLYWGVPHLWVRSLEDDAVQDAVHAMASDLGGYWLSYCARAARERPEVPVPLKVPFVELVDHDGDSAVVHAVLGDGREFSMLACTPAWFKSAFESAGLPYYWGPSPVFLSKIEPSLAKKAASEMGKQGDRWLCLYDTPRTTLSKVLGDFKTRRGL